MRTIALSIAALLITVTMIATGSDESKSKPQVEQKPAEWKSDRFVVHEWGTFTSFSGADGVKLEFRPLVDNDLPQFVFNRDRQSGNMLALFMKRDWSVFQRMETPVTYFYTDRIRQARVRVGFPTGLLTEFYPPVETMKPNRGVANKKQMRDSELDWGDVWLIPEDKIRLDAGDQKIERQLQESLVRRLLPQDTRINYFGKPKENHYAYARETDSALVYVQRKLASKTRPNAPNGDFFEKFLFYRGIGNFDLPLKLTAHSDGRFELFNGAEQPITSLFLVTVDGDSIRFTKHDKIDPGQRINLVQSDRTSTVDALSESVVESLIAEKLYEKEARAMVKTWKTSWFGEQGTRLFYMLPQQVTDELLPLKVEPTPDETVRVLVGRLEIMTPEEETRVINLVRQSAKSRRQLKSKLAANIPGTPGAVGPPGGAAAQYVFPAAIRKMGRLAEPALVRIRLICKDNVVRNEAAILLLEVQARIKQQQLTKSAKNRGLTLSARAD